ncbi:helix-turn-helix transcriptional regulator [Azospirillum sp. SYSU D00513]|uniref:helix-turn-helix domain-containing protein n=1 Tax=Azospirillum sp. SYSU D00513 TaxID=2812561 RepID=UPI001A97BFDC|nr:helix-turn-helix transcriptional regulator [Azospirillum sp. SYSU D00513]
MYSTPIMGSGEHAKRLRKESGKWLKSLRERAELTQNDVANAVGYEYYTMISQIESGKGRVAPDKYLSYAQALKVNPQWFMRNLLKFYDPFCYELLFGPPE